MNGFILRVGVLALLATGLSYGEASAESEKDLSCKHYGAEVVNNRYSFQEVNTMLTTAAVEADIPPEVVKAVAAQESGWNQFKMNGEPNISNDKGIGIMQITNLANFNEEEIEKLKTDITFNITTGVNILNDMFDRTDLPKVKDAGRHTLENWYFPVMAYNGIKPTNSPLSQLTNEKNLDAYQEDVFRHIECGSFLDNTQLGEFPFTLADFDYDRDSDQNIKFLEKEFVLEDTHESAYFFKAEDRVVVTGDNVKVRDDNSTSSNIETYLDKNTPLIVTGAFEYEKSMKPNQFVWYPVQTLDGKAGYISSAYLTKANTKTFSDVEEKYQAAVDFLVTKGIQGKPDGTFGTQEPITRQDAAIFVAKALNLDTVNAPQAGFTDVNNRAVGAVNALKVEGITNGKTATTFGGGDLITRGELAKWITVAFDLEAGNVENPFTDVDGQYVDAVKALVENEVTLGKTATTFGTKENATRGQFALFVYRAAQASQQ